MQTICGECIKPYSKNCEIKERCRVHNRLCFRCQECKDTTVVLALQNCSICREQCHTDEAFFDIRCQRYICKKQFKAIDFSKAEVRLPCGGECLQIREHVVAFLSHFCITCQRKLTDVDCNEVRSCKICIQKSISKIDNKSGKGIKEDPHQLKLSDWVKKNVPSIFSDFLNLNSEEMNKEKEKQKQKEEKKEEKNLNIIIQILNQDFKSVQDQLKISQFTRMQLRKKLLAVQRDKQCPICTMSYTSTLKPMMICLQQHLICQNCFRDKNSLKNCPLCSELIQRDKVRACRERLRTLELESIMAERYESKYKRYVSQCNNNFTELRYKYEIKDAEMQTVPQVTPAQSVTENSCSRSVPPPPPAPKRQRDMSKPQNGPKKQKK